MGPNCKVQLLTLNDPNFRAIQIDSCTWTRLLVFDVVIDLIQEIAKVMI